MKMRRERSARLINWKVMVTAPQITKDHKKSRSSKRTLTTLPTLVTSTLVIHHKSSEVCSILDQPTPGCWTHTLHCQATPWRSIRSTTRNRARSRRLIRELTLSLDQVHSWATLFMTTWELDRAMGNQTDKFTSWTNILETLRSNRPSSQARTSKLSSAWLTQLLQRKEWPPCSMRWCSRNFCKAMCSRSTLRLRIERQKVTNLNWLLVTTTEQSSQEILSGIQLSSGTCTVFNLMTFSSTESLLMFAAAPRLVL